MSVKLYMDVHVKRAVIDGLRLRGVDVLTAQEDGTTTLEDEQLLDRATGLGRVLFTQDEDFLAEAQRRQLGGGMFAGLAYAHQTRATAGQLVNDLELLAKASDPADMLNRVEHLPF